MKMLVILTLLVGQCDDSVNLLNALCHALPVVSVELELQEGKRTDLSSARHHSSS